MEGFPSALIIASQEAVFRNNNVLYRLVKPLPDRTGVQSTDRMVNVIPHRRKYTFDRLDELDNFGYELLRRPLVLQPVLHFGRGFGHNCGMCYQDEPWIIMVNQTHPKILGRLQMGMDSARRAMAKGQAFSIKFRFGKLIQRVYRAHLAQKELGEAQASRNPCSEFATYFRFAEWEHGDLLLRYLGSSNSRLMSVEMRWDFEDIGMHEMMWSQVEGQEFHKPHMAPVSEEEIRQLLPAWTVNSVSPLEYIGETVPQQNYSYAQAGRLYESFRKKKRHRNQPQVDSSQEHPDYRDFEKVPAYRDDYSEEPYHDDYDEDVHEGASGFDPSATPRYVDPDNIVTEHDFSHNDYGRPTTSARSRGRYQDPQDDPTHDEGYHYNETAGPGSHHPRSSQQPHYDIEDSGPGVKNKKGGSAAPYPPSHNSQQYHLQKSPQAVSNPDKYGHIHANVQITSRKTTQERSEAQTTNSRKHLAGPDSSYYNTSDTSASYYNHSEPALKKQDSDRSSRSTNADSGYCPEGDGWRSRGDSYDYNEQSRSGNHQDDGGLANPAFRYEDIESDHALKKHKELVSRMMNGQSGGQQPRNAASSVNHQIQGPRSPYALSPKDLAADVMRAPPRQKRVPHSSSSSEQVAESFI